MSTLRAGLISPVDCSHLLVTIVRGYGMHSTACPGPRERRPTVAGLAAVVLCSFMSLGCLHASVLDTAACEPSEEAEWVQYPAS